MRRMENPRGCYVHSGYSGDTCGDESKCRPFPEDDAAVWAKVPARVLPREQAGWARLQSSQRVRFQ